MKGERQHTDFNEYDDTPGNMSEMWFYSDTR